jgi:thiol-disulfide isomerase/thioredoxin
MSVQLWALLVVSLVVMTVLGAEKWRAVRGRQRSLGIVGATSSEPYILYFTGEGCTVCRTHQEPALARLSEVRIDKIDAIAQRELADRFSVYTLPTTVVMSSAGRALHVNYGYATVGKLERQLAEARSNDKLPVGATA